MMRRFVIWLCLCSQAVGMISCKSSDVASNSLLQKRKYRKGVHYSFPKNRKGSFALRGERRGDVRQRVQVQAKDERVLVQPVSKVELVSCKKGFPIVMKALKKQGDVESITEIDGKKTIVPLALASYPPVEDYFGESEKSNKKVDKLALASVILGFLAILLPLLGVVLAILALIFGIQGLPSEKNRWMAITGITIGSIYLAIILVLVAVFLI